MRRSGALISHISDKRVPYLVVRLMFEKPDYMINEGKDVMCPLVSPKFRVEAPLVILVYSDRVRSFPKLQFLSRRTLSPITQTKDGRCRTQLSRLSEKTFLS